MITKCPRSQTQTIYSHGTMTALHLASPRPALGVIKNVCSIGQTDPLSLNSESWIASLAGPLGTFTLPWACQLPYLTLYMWGNMSPSPLCCSRMRAFCRKRESFAVRFIQDTINSMSTEKTVSYLIMGNGWPHQLKYAKRVWDDWIQGCEQ